MSESQSSLPNTFGRMIGSGQPAEPKVVKDRYNRPPPTYNYNYNPEEPARDNLPKGYSPYVCGEPLYDDRLVIVARLPPRHTVVGAGKRLRTQWVWNLGYTLDDNSKTKSTLVWACKHCKLSFNLV